MPGRVGVRRRVAFHSPDGDEAKFRRAWASGDMAGNARQAFMGQVASLRATLRVETNLFWGEVGPGGDQS
jgi:hypothetical protein